MRVGWERQKVPDSPLSPADEPGESLAHSLSIQNNVIALLLNTLDCPAAASRESNVITQLELCQHETSSIQTAH